jgi:hypothetical protein
MMKKEDGAEVREEMLRGGEEKEEAKVEKEN